MKKQNTIAVLIASLLLVAMLSFAIAENESVAGVGKGYGSQVKNITNATERHEAVQELKNASRTFGQCVAEAAKLRNDCYRTADDARKNCTDVAKKDKAASAQCKAVNKDGRNSCKTVFKSAKNECNAIKHNAWDSIKASFA